MEKTNDLEYELLHGAEVMSDEAVIEYNIESSLSFVTSLQTIFGIMAGFVFTGTTVVLSTLGEPVALLSQLVLFVLFCAMVMFTTAMYELHLVNNLVSWQSPKQIVPLYPARLASSTRSES